MNAEELSRATYLIYQELVPPKRSSAVFAFFESIGKSASVIEMKFLLDEIRRLAEEREEEGLWEGQGISLKEANRYRKLIERFVVEERREWLSE